MISRRQYLKISSGPMAVKHLAEKVLALPLLRKINAE